MRIKIKQEHNVTTNPASFGGRKTEKMMMTHGDSAAIDLLAENNGLSVLELACVAD